MKKVFKFFMAAAIVAAGFTACSSEEVSPVVQGGGDDTGGGGTPTYATFKFDFAQTASSKALADYDPAEATEADTKDDDFAAGDPWLLIFNAQTKAVEHCAQVTGTSETVLVTAGDKKIFVVANASKLSDTGGGATDNFTNRMADFVSKTKTLDDFYALTFSAGTPQGKGAATPVMTNAEKIATASTFSIEPLYTHGNADAANAITSQGLPASSTNGPTFTLKEGITQAQAEDGSVTASTDGANANNRFEIQLYYMLAKARLVTGPNALSDGTGANPNVINSVKYGIKNLATHTYYVQHVSAGIKMSYYHAMFPYGDGETTPPQSTYDPHFDYASNVSTLAPASTAPGNYLYVPENTSASILMKGQASYFAINATYEPAEVVKTVAHDMNTGLVTETDKLAAIGALSGEGAKDYIQTQIEIEGIAKYSFFKTLALLKQAAWIKKYGTAANMWSGSAAQLGQADAIIADAITANGGVSDNVYYVFNNAQSWYRLYIGEGSGTSTVYGVLRGNKYTATINNITGPGMPSEGHLTEDPWEPVSAVTYINATILAAQWTAVNQDDDLK